MFSAVYAEHFAFVRRVLRRLGVSENDLDDAAQEVFLVVHRRLPTFEGRSSMRTWLFGIALRVASHDRRRAAARPRLDVPPAEPAARVGGDPFDSALRSEAERLLDRLVQELDEDRRAVFVSVDVEQMTMREAGEALGVSTTTVAWRLRAARKQINEAAGQLVAEGSRRSR